jgi:hypothetical protein
MAVWPCEDDETQLMLRGAELVHADRAPEMTFVEEEAPERAPEMVFVEKEAPGRAPEMVFVEEEVPGSAPEMVFVEEEAPGRAPEMVFVEEEVPERAPEMVSGSLLPTRGGLRTPLRTLRQAFATKPISGPKRKDCNRKISVLRMRSSLVVRASDCQCTSCNGPGFDPSIRSHSGI